MFSTKQPSLLSVLNTKSHNTLRSSPHYFYLHTVASSFCPKSHNQKASEQETPSFWLWLCWTHCGKTSHINTRRLNKSKTFCKKGRFYLEVNSVPTDFNWTGTSHSMRSIERSSGEGAIENFFPALLDWCPPSVLIRGQANAPSLFWRKYSFS